MRNAILTLALFAVSSIAAPAPYPVIINSRAQTAPPLTVYRAAESLFRVSFVDGDKASDITGATAFMSFATNATAAVVSTASVSVVAGMTGIVDCVFSPAAVNVAAGRYMYEVGVTPTGGTARIYRQGVFTVVASPYAGSAAAVTWATNMTWGTINWTGLPDWLLVSETAGWETGSHAGFVTNSADFYPVSNPSNYITIADVPAQTAYWPPDATASSWFTFVTNSGAITITDYNIEGGAAVIIPDYINGLPVTGIGNNAFRGRGVTSIGGAGNVVTVGDSAFDSCYSLASVSLPQVQTVRSYAFVDCTSLASVSLPQAQTIGNNAFYYCGVLTSVYFDSDAPTIGAYIFDGITPNQVTNYVTNPQATGWGATLGGSMPVVRLPLPADALTLGGVTHTNWPSADVSGLATTQSVAAVAGDLDVAQIDINNHTSNGTIGSDGHASSAEKANWNGKLSASGGTASNLTVRGWIAMPQSAPTNLVLRLVCSNEHIIVQEVYP
jgi:hypothetical protein